jgi:hypothetical protein
MSDKQKPIPKGDAITHLVRDIFMTQDDEIQCEQAQIQIVRSLKGAALSSDKASRQQYPLLWHHFRFCPHCARDYKMFRELTRAAAAGMLEYPTFVPPRPDQARPPIWGLAKDAIKALFQGFSPTMSLALQRGASLGVEPTEVLLNDGEVSVSFDVEVDENDPTLRDLFCTVESEEEANDTRTEKALEENLEGSLVWLQLGDEGPVVHEQALDLFGEVTFSAVQPGRYMWRLNLAGQVYAVLGLELP